MPELNPWKSKARKSFGDGKRAARLDTSSPGTAREERGMGKTDRESQRESEVRIELTST